MFGRQSRSALSLFKLCLRSRGGERRGGKTFSPTKGSYVSVDVAVGETNHGAVQWRVCTWNFVFLKGAIIKINLLFAAITWGCVCAFVYTLLVFSNCVGQILLLVMVRHLSWLWWCHMSLTFFDQTWSPPCSSRMHMKYISLSSAGWLFKHG